MIYLFERDKLENWAYWDNLFTPNECLQIINIGNSLPKNTGVLEGSNPLDLEIRDSNVSWIIHDKNTKWIFDRLADAVIELNNRYFKFDLYGFTEHLQFTEYKAPTGHYIKHIDRGMTMQPRKLSLVLQLSNPSTYTGGNLELQYEHNPLIAPKDIGKLIVFPSYTLHGVTPITSGTRYSLVSWLSGPNFK
jgi:PKHD-type hydroxylase